MRKQVIHKIITLFIGIILIWPVLTKGQTGFRNEKEMKLEATALYAADKFVLAFPLYSQLLSLDPENYELNYRFGVCLLYSSRTNIEGPIPYLEKAINKIQDVELYYYLAVAYHQNYFFTDAIYNYRKYIQLAKNKQRKDFDVERKIFMCQNGIEMLMSVDELYVIEKSEVNREAFHRSYNLLDYGGRILNLPKEFLNKNERKNQEDRIAFFNSKSKLLFYSLENKNQKDIYYRWKQNGGNWSDAIALDETINTNYDEEYPILMPDGKTLYFCSKGHNTMGGYDIFQSVFDSVSKQWSSPVNLSFPFSTPADDILFIANSDESAAWFASDRNSNPDKIAVYKVGIIKKSQATADLSEIFNKGNISRKDVGKIKDMANLDINISSKKFDGIPINKSRKLDAFLKNDASRLSENIHKVNLVNVDKQIATKALESNLIETVKDQVQTIDFKLESLKSLFLQTQYLVTSKGEQVQLGYKEVTKLLEKAQNDPFLNRRKGVINDANKMLFQTLRSEFQYQRLSLIERNIDKQISAERVLLAQTTALFGDIQKQIVLRDDAKAMQNILLLNNIIKQADTLTDYTQIIDYSIGEFISIVYPDHLLNENEFSEFYLDDINAFPAAIASKKIAFSTLIPLTGNRPKSEKQFQQADAVSQQEADAFQLQDESIQRPVENTKTESNAPTENEESKNIRKELAALIREQNDRIEYIKEQSNRLTQLAANKLDASNTLLYNFELAREQLSNGEINNQDSVIDIQSKSQDLLYQSLGIISLNEKFDSILQVEEIGKAEATNQIFDIEQALKSNQINQALTLFNSLKKASNIKAYNQTELIKNWIESNIKNIPSQQDLANRAFENSQKLTDASIQLLEEANELREKVKSKTNVFKRRQLTLEAEDKEKSAATLKSDSDHQLALGMGIYEGIKKAIAIQEIESEITSPSDYAQNNSNLVNPEKRKIELQKRLEDRDLEVVPISDSSLLSSSNELRFFHGEQPEINDLINYELKRYKAELLAEELDINKRETVQLLEISKTLSGKNARDNKLKISSLRNISNNLQQRSMQAFTEAGNSYKLLTPEEKNKAQEEGKDIDNYLSKLKSYINLILKDVLLLNESAKYEEDINRKKDLQFQADEKEQIAMYYILEEFEIISQRNNQNYRKNTLVFDQLYQENISYEEQKLMKDILNQLELLMKQSASKRIKAKNNEISFMLRKTLLQDAGAIESSALDIQLEAIRMMRNRDLQAMLDYTRKPLPKTNSPIEAASKEITPEIKPTNQIRQQVQAPAKESFVSKNRKAITTRIDKTAEQKIEISDQTKIENKPNRTKVFAEVNLDNEPTTTQFSVQIAAITSLKTTASFLNVIELFAIQDQNIYRYFSGRFTNVKSAIIRRNALRRQGYSDAFIKSWKGGKTVTLSEAAGNLDEATIKLLNENSNNLASKYRNINFAATNISQLTGVYYTVQIGVFSRPRASSNLFNINPLYHNRLTNGNWVYFNGIYKSIADAEQNKLSIQTMGIRDAFIVAFNGGEKTSLVGARNAFRQGSRYPANEDIIILKDAALAVDEQLKTLISHEPLAARTTTYRIQIGVYSHTLSFNKLDSRLTNGITIEYFINPSGNYVYTVGNFNSYEEATRYNTQNIKPIIKDSFIVSFNNGKKN